jgi:uncharacterized protein YozE (UPF0346 family)
MKFYDWIMQFKDEDSIAGDLAGDIFQDKNFPRIDKLEVMIEYLNTQSADELAIDALKETYKEWNCRES